MFAKTPRGVGHLHWPRARSKLRFDWPRQLLLSARDSLISSAKCTLPTTAQRCALITTSKVTTLRFPRWATQWASALLFKLFDCSLRVSLALGMLRLVCTNGMQTLEKEFDMLKKHSAQLDLDKLLTTEAIDSALNRFKESGDVRAFGDAKITQDEGKAALGNLLKKNVFSEKVREGIAHRFDNPTYEEDGKAATSATFTNSTTRWLNTSPPTTSPTPLVTRGPHGGHSFWVRQPHQWQRLKSLIALLPTKTTWPLVAMSQARRASDCSKLGEPQPQTPRCKAGFFFALLICTMLLISPNWIWAYTYYFGASPILVRTRTKCYSQRLL